MPTKRWYELGRVISDHEGWEEEKDRLEARIRSCVKAAGEEYASVIFAAWGRLPGDVRVFLYETCSLAVRELFQVAALEDCVDTGIHWKNEPREKTGGTP